MGYPFGTAEIYDPVANTWSAAGSPATPRQHHTATLLQNGNVSWLWMALTVIRLPTRRSMIPPLDVWTVTTPPAHARLGHTATLLPNGAVLVTGGHGSTSAVPPAEVYR